MQKLQTSNTRPTWFFAASPTSLLSVRSPGYERRGDAVALVIGADLHPSVLPHRNAAAWRFFVCFLRLVEGDRGDILGKTYCSGERWGRTISNFNSILPCTHVYKNTQDLSGEGS